MENLQEKILEIKKPAEVEIQGLGKYEVYLLEDVVYIINKLLEQNGNK